MAAEYEDEVTGEVRDLGVLSTGYEYTTRCARLALGQKDGSKSIAQVGEISPEIEVQSSTADSMVAIAESPEQGLDAETEARSSGWES